MGSKAVHPMTTVTTASGVAFARAYDAKLREIAILLFLSALIALGTEVALFALTRRDDPSWIKSLPCIYQTDDVKTELMKVPKMLSWIQEVLDIMPMAIIILAIGFAMREGKPTPTT